jgi:AcrR family transcriptional regulator
MAKEDTRKKILEAAEKLFSSKGYDGVATKAIAEEAGITEMTLFNHFAKKELLYKTVVKERYTSSEINSVFSNLTYNDLEKDLTTISNELVVSFIKNKNILLMRLKEQKNFSKDRDFKLERDPVLNQIIPIFKVYKEKGLLNGSSEKAAFLFMGSIKGLFYVCLLDDKEETEIKELIRDFVITICNGLLFNKEF